MKVFDWLCGRTTAFLIFFTLTGTVLHVFHRLDGTYIGFIGVIMGFVFTHSVKEDMVSAPGAKKDVPADPPAAADAK